MYCITCGYSVEDNHRFCANCGTVKDAPSGSLADSLTDLLNDSADDSEDGLTQSLESAPTVESLEDEDEFASTTAYLEASHTVDMPVPDMPVPDCPPPVRPAAPVHGYPNTTLINSVYPAPHMQFAPHMQQPPNLNEKFFFGKAAFVICLAIIGVLSMSTALFAGLYFSEIGGF